MSEQQEDLPEGIETEEELEERLDQLRDTRRPFRTRVDGPRMFIYQFEYAGESHDFRAIHVSHPADFRMILGEEPEDVEEAWVLNHISGEPAYGHNHLFEEPKEMEKTILEAVQADEPFYCECENPEQMEAIDKCMSCMRPVEE